MCHLNINILLVMFWCTMSSCGALPHNKRATVQAPVNSTAAMSGISFITTKARTSSSVYFYDLRGGSVKLLTGGESSDVLTSWLDNRLFIFNRDAGRMSYSSLAPNKGVGSRSMERPTPGATQFDPSDVAMTRDGELLLAMNNSGKFVVAKESDNSVITILSDINTGLADQLFHPAGFYLEEYNGDSVAWVSHQAYDAQIIATGGGRLFQAVKPSQGVWQWKSKQGIVLNVSNPIYLSPRPGRKLLVAGVCYKNWGSKCVAGIDMVDLETQTVVHISSWDSSLWEANGGFYADLTDESLLVSAISKREGVAQNVLARYDIASGTMQTVKLLSGFWCGGVVADRNNEQLFVGEPLSNGQGLFSVLDVANSPIMSFLLDDPVSGLTAVYED